MSPYLASPPTFDTFFLIFTNCLSFYYLITYTRNGTEWPFLSWCADRTLRTLTHSLTHSLLGVPSRAPTKSRNAFSIGVSVGLSVCRFYVFISNTNSLCMHPGHWWLSVQPIYQLVDSPLSPVIAIHCTFSYCVFFEHGVSCSVIACLHVHGWLV